MAIAVKILRQGSKTTDNKLIVTAGSADTGQLKIQYNGTDIYNNLSGGTADILLGVANTDIYMPLDSNNEIEKGTYRIIFEASVGTSDDQQIGFNVSELNPIINQEVDIYSPYIRLDDNTNYTPANSTVTSSTRTFTLKYPAGSNQSNIVSTTTDIGYDLYITTNNVWTGASQATVNYNVTYTILGVPYAGGNYIDFTYQEIGSGYEPIEVDEENTLCDLYDNINLLREKVYAANISRRGDYATLLSNYQYVGALMSQFREAITCDKTAAAEDILSQIKYIVGAGVPPTASSKASRRVYGASSQITMTISDASLEVQNVDNIIFSGATLTDNGDGQVTLTIENSPTLTVTDGVTTVNTVDNITFTGATVTDEGSGDVTVAITGGGGGGAVDSVNGETGAVVLTTGDIAEDTDANYVTDAQLTVIVNTSGTNTGDQDLSGLVPYTGATQNVDLGEHQLSTGQVTFDQTPTQSAGVGVLRWNDTDGTLDLGLKGGNATLQIGQEQFIRVRADETITNGDAVYATGAVGATGRITVAKFIANGTIDELYFIGVATEDITSNQEGFITTFGTVRGLNLTNGGNIYGETGYTEGTILYASPTTSGYLTKTKPEAPNLSIPVAIVLHADANGQVQVRPTTGFHINELHDVLITDISDNELLQWNSAGYWENRTLSEAGIQPAGNYILSDIIGVEGADVVTNIISLTQAEYNLIATPDASTIYNITDAPPPTGLQAVVDDTAPVLGGNLNANNFEVSNLSRINTTTTSVIISGAASGATALQNVVEDTTPQLGGSLDTLGNAITGNYSTDGYRGIITEATTVRSTSLTDAGDFILFDNATSSEYRILDNTSVPFPIGTEIDLLQKGVGVLSIAAVAGVRLNGIDAGSTAVTARWGGATIKKIAINEWIIVGKINDVA